MNKRTLITTAAAIFAAGTFATAAHAEGVKCAGANACKGQSACKGGSASPGKGMNCLQGSGLGRGQGRRGLHRCRRQGDVRRQAKR